MRKFKWIIGVILISGGIFFIGSLFQEKKVTNMSMKEIIEKNYMNNEGYIHAYPNQIDSQYLSESIGLYMEYLVQANDAEAFQQEVQKLEKEFLIETDKHTFIQWAIFETAHVNALIDDVRIIAALQHASEKFEQPTYNKLAAELKQGLTEKMQLDGYYPDFYDWSYDTTSARVVLSYLSPEFFHVLTNTKQSLELLKELSHLEQVFFPEIYDLEIGDFQLAEHVHMIDQLLIASNREHIEEPSPAFQEWLIQEWDTKGKLFGQYHRTTLEPVVNYESLSVYYYLHAYFELVGENEQADKVIERAKQIEHSTELKNVHFFDFILGQQLTH